MTDVGIVGYGLGNVRSVLNACRFVGAEARICVTPDTLGACRRIILPGVGSFPDGMRRLGSGGWIEALSGQVRHEGKPLLGICLGMQLLATIGTEHGEHEGLGWIEGRVVRLTRTRPDLRIPHIGWNDVDASGEGTLLDGLTSAPVFYFVHSYAFVPEDPAVVSATCDYGQRFAASVQRDNIYATQFHPEKSQHAGLHVLRRFLERS